MLSEPVKRLQPCHLKRAFERAGLLCCGPVAQAWCLRLAETRRLQTSHTGPVIIIRCVWYGRRNCRLHFSTSPLCSSMRWNKRVCLHRTVPVWRPVQLRPIFLSTTHPLRLIESSFSSSVLLAAVCLADHFPLYGERDGDWGMELHCSEDSVLSVR